MDRKEIKLLLNSLENYPEDHNSLQHKFIVALKKHYQSTGVLTKRQLECLCEIKEYILVAEAGGKESEPDNYQAQYSTFDYSTPFRMRTL